MRQQSDFSDFWDMIKGIILLVGILLFFVGWVYLSYYFKNFGIFINGIKTEFFTYYLFGFFAAQKPAFLWFWIAMLVALFVVFRFRSHLGSIYLNLAILSMVIFPVTWAITRSIAENQVLSMLNGDTQVFPITLSFKQSFLESVFVAGNGNNDSTYQKNLISNKEVLQDIIGNMQNYKLKQFYEDDDNHYVYINHNPPNATNKSMSIAVFSIPKACVDYSFLVVDQSIKY